MPISSRHFLTQGYAQDICELLVCTIRRWVTHSFRCGSQAAVKRIFKMAVDNRLNFTRVVLLESKSVLLVRH